MSSTILLPTIKETKAVLDSTRLPSHLKIDVTQIDPERNTLVAKIGRYQNDAYFRRLNYQPDGQEVKRLLARDNNFNKGQKFAELMAEPIFDGLTALGKQALQLLRQYGKDLKRIEAVKLAISNPVEFDSKLLTGLQGSSGEEIHLSEKLILTVSDIFHQAWNIAKEQQTNFQSASQRNKALQKVNLKLSTFILPPAAANRDNLTVLMFCEILAELSDQEFIKLLSYASDQKLDDDFKINTKPLGSELNNTTVVLESAKRDIDLSNLTISNKYRPKDRLIVNKLQSDLESFKKTCKSREEKLVLKHLFNSISAGTCLDDDELRKLFAPLTEAREQLFKTLEFAVSCAQGNKISTQDARTLTSLLATKTLPNNAANGLKRVLNNYNEQLQKVTIDTVLNYSVENFTSGDIALTSKVEDIEQVIALIKEHNKTGPDQEQFLVNGGIGSNYYNPKFWQGFFANNGKLLVYYDQNSSSKEKSTVLGFAIYYDLETAPDEHHNIPDTIRGKKDIYWDLVGVSNEASGQGIAKKLFKCAIAHANLLKSESIHLHIYKHNPKSIKAHVDCGAVPTPLETDLYCEQYKLVPFIRPVSEEAQEIVYNILQLNTAADQLLSDC